MRRRISGHACNLIFIPANYLAGYLRRNVIDDFSAQFAFQLESRLMDSGIIVTEGLAIGRKSISHK
jgi:hypothetical protein